MRYICVATTVLLLLVGCSSDPSIADLDFDEAAWATALAEHRKAKDEKFATSSTSPMAGTQYLKSEPADLVFLTRSARTFELAYESTDSAILVTEKSDGTWSWRALDPDAIHREGDDAVEDLDILDGPAIFVSDDLHLSFYPAADRVTFIVFDPEREKMTSFEHLLYYPPDPGFALSARIEELAEPEEFVMLTSRNLEKTFYRFARIRFTVDGREQTLTAFKYALVGKGSNTLFIPFRDATSGDETYGAGRFLEIDAPDSDRFIFDLNHAFSPLCNYSPAYNCAIPPRENHLNVAIRAGEKTYPH